MKKRGIFYAIIGFLVMTLSLVFLKTPREPEYQGIKLTRWLERAAGGQYQEQSAAFKALHSMGPDTVPFLLRVIQKRETTVDRWYQSFYNTVAYFNSSKLNLQSWFPKPPNLVAHKLQAALFLDRTGTNILPIVPQLLELLDHQPTMVKVTLLHSVAIVAANSSYQNEVLDAVIRSASAHVSYERSIAHSHLGSFRNQLEKVLPILIKGLEGDDTNVIWGAAVSVGNLGPRAISAMPALLKSMERTQIAEFNVEAIGNIAPNSAFESESVDVLIAAANHTNETIRKLAVKAIGRFPAKADRLLPVLIRGLNDPDNAVFSAVVESLGMFGAKASAAVPALLGHSQRAHYNAQVLETLKLINPDAAEKVGTK